MNITKELLEKEIVQMESRHNNYRALADQTAGALVVLKDLRTFLDRPEPPEISEENKAVQDALTPEELAEIVAGPGAVVEQISPIADAVKEIKNG